jgi:excisionase family DNA binding protein
MSEKLLNVKEVCQYLDISEEDLRSLVDRGEIPAYRLGGTILRFKKDQIDRIRAQGVPELSQLEEEAAPDAAEERIERLKDFIYFNDFYISCAIIGLILLIIIFFY